MLLLIGWSMVVLSVLVGFVMNGGDLRNLFHPGEVLIVVGIMFGFIFGSSPPSLLKTMFIQIKNATGRTPFPAERYLDLTKALYELFMIAREQGVVGIEEHVLNPQASAVFAKYPSFVNDPHAVGFLQDALRPLIEGRMKPEQLRAALSEDVERIRNHSYLPLIVLNKVADALPGVGIVAAVLGIMVTMQFIAGEKQEIGERVAAALSGTFYGLLISYGIIQPMIIKIELMNEDEVNYFQVMCNMIVSYATGAPPIMAAEAGRRAIPPDRQPNSEILESTLKSIKRVTV
jgi:chemotaxis protein MotA